MHDERTPLDGVRPLSLAQPLAQSQIDAASNFWSSGWESKELAQLDKSSPSVMMRSG